MSLLPDSKTPPKTGLEEFTILIYGKPKIGKTTFANQFENTLFLATEAGLTGQEAYQVVIDSWDTFKQAVEELTNAKHVFKTVAIDTIDNLYKLCVEWGNALLGVVHQSDAAYGKAYDLINSEFLKWLARLSFLPTGLIMVSHAKEKEIRPRAGAAYTYISPTLPDSARKIVIGMADLILFFDTDFEQVGDKTIEKRVIHTAASNNFEAGGRINWLPPVLPLDFQVFKEVFMAGIKQLLCEDCGKPIEKTEKATAWQLATWSKKKYGRQLCEKCLKSLSKNEKKKEAVNQ